MSGVLTDPPNAPQVSAPVAPDTPGNALVLRDDVACEACRYNLRGLSEGGPCPECGHAVGASLATLRVSRALRGPPDAAWARRIREGAWLSLGTLAVIVLTALAPDGWSGYAFRYPHAWESPRRAVALGVVCTSWVQAWASAWRLTAREPLSAYRPSPAVVAYITRWLMGAYLTLPFVWAVATWGASSDSRIDGIWVLVLIALMLCGVAGGVGLLVRVGQLHRRMGGRVAFVEACVMGLALPLAVFLGADSGGPSSLELMWHLPALPYEAPVVVQWCVEALRFESYARREPEVWFHLGLLVWTVSLVVRLLWAYRRAGVR